MRVDIICDMQYGSCAKGAIAQYLVNNKRYTASVRVQSIQAGHTIYYKGKPFVMRTIPCAWVNPNVMLILGAGIFIEKELLMREIKMLEDAGIDIRSRLFIDYRANYVLPEDKEAETKGKLNRKIGSTGEGAGSSLIRKIWRKTGAQRVIDDSWMADNKLQVCDTIKLMNHLDSVLVEGCQGTMLALHTSPQYPFVTSRECTVSGILSECGLAPFDVENVHGVFRTYPIRVGGNSGETASKELTWEEIAERSGIHGLIPEKTTVTQRNRRIFEYSASEMHHAMLINKPNHLYCTFVDYLGAENYGLTQYDDLTPRAKSWIKDREKELGVIDWLSTGEQAEHYIIQ